MKTIRALAFLAAGLIPLPSGAWYIPCFCGCGLPIEYMTSVQHVNHYPLETEKTAKTLEILRNAMSQLQTMIKTYNNLKETYDTIGQVRNMAENFDFSRIASTWEVEDWNDLKDLAKRIDSTKGWNKTDTGNSTAKAQTETSFLSSLLKDAAELTHEAETDLDSFERSLREINSINSDSAIRAILAQETRNSRLKARAAIASQQAKSTSDAIAAAGGGLANDSASVADRAESSVISKSSEVSMWSDMANSINRATLMRMQSVEAYVEGRRNAILKEKADNVFNTD